MSQKVLIKATLFDKRGKIISIGYNSYTKTHPIMKKYANQCGFPDKEFLHAEVDAIVKCKDKVPYKITVERYDKKGNPMNAEPCEICKSILQDSGVKVIEFTK